jgi:quinol monooxygenase YgiN
MVRVIIILQTKSADDVEKVKGLLAQQGQLSRKEPGCARFEVYHSSHDPTTFILNEWWETQAALDEHRKATAYTTIYAPQVLPLVNRTPHPSVLVE